VKSILDERMRVNNLNYCWFGYLSFPVNSFPPAYLSSSPKAKNQTYTAVIHSLCKIGFWLEDVSTLFNHQNLNTLTFRMAESQYSGGVGVQLCEWGLLKESHDSEGVVLTYSQNGPEQIASKRRDSPKRMRARLVTGGYCTV
jgi:hypothetical protein